MVFPAGMVCLGLLPPTQIIPVFAVSNIVLEEVTSVEQEQACWHFVKTFNLLYYNWVEVEGWLRLELGSYPCTCLTDMITQ